AAAGVLFRLGFFGFFGTRLLLLAGIADLYGVHKAFAQAFRKGQHFRAAVIVKMKRRLLLEWFIGIAQAVALLLPVGGVDQLVADIDAALLVKRDRKADAVDAVEVGDGGVKHRVFFARVSHAHEHALDGVFAVVHHHAANEAFQKFGVFGGR